MGQRLRGIDVVESCNRLVAQRGAPVRVFVDNGNEFSGRLMDLWAYHHSAQIDFSRPGKPTDNCFVETLNGSFRDEWLNLQRFESLEEARVNIEAWRIDTLTVVLIKVPRNDSDGICLEIYIIRVGDGPTTGRRLALQVVLETIADQTDHFLNHQWTEEFARH